MNLFETLRGIFNPKIKKEFNSLIAERKEAIQVWNNKYAKIESLAYNLSFKEKKIIVSYKEEILKIDADIRQERECKQKYYSIKAKFPLGCKYFEENCIYYGEDSISKVISNAELIKKYQDVCIKYERLKRLYPLGLPIFEKETSYDDGKNSAELTIEEIIECEDQISQCEIQERSRLDEERKGKERIRRANYKDESGEIKNLLEENGIKCFYHFTSRDNLSSIKRLGGLYSWNYLKSHNIVILDQGGDELSRNLDVRYGLQDFVRLSFCESHPMAYRKICDGSDIIILKISTEVALLKNTQFSDMNATDGMHSHGLNLADLEKVNFSATQRKYVKRDDPDFKYLQAEVMVKTCVPIKYIININDFC